MENKSLQVRKENVFSKVINFIKGLFKINEETPIAKPVIEKVKVEPATTNFMDSIKIEQDDPSIMKLQKQFENNEMDLCLMSNEEVHSLNSLYNKQIANLKDKLNIKKTELNLLKSRVQNLSTNN